VEFVSVDQCKEEAGPTERPSPGPCDLPERQVLVAYEMNGEELSEGATGSLCALWCRGPLRALRQVAAGDYSAATTSATASSSRGTYKMFPPSVDWDNVQWHTRRPIIDFPVQSAITQPCDGDSVAPGQLQKIKGTPSLGEGGR